MLLCCTCDHDMQLIHMTMPYCYQHHPRLYISLNHIELNVVQLAEVRIWGQALSCQRAHCIGCKLYRLQTV